MPTASEAVRALQAMGAKQAESIARSPTGINPGFDPSTGITWTEDGRARYRTTVAGSAGLLVATALFSGAQSISSGGTPTIIDFDDVTYDPNGWITPGASWAFTPTVSAKYLIFMGVLTNQKTWPVNGIAYIGYYLGASGDILFDQQLPYSTSNVAIFLQASRVVSIAASDTFTPQIYHEQGGSVNIGLGVSDGIEIYQF